ncbi:MAG TPA: divalent-cation tolerance protein CutA [Candidatus Xenobia bacterium]|nr:divalent-cation tolerance protein CutA [Candidatus Xenobia bacterium]
MTDKVVILATCGSGKEAKRIAQALVEQRLAACVNLSRPIRSVYRWQGEVRDEPEVLLIIKTVRGLFDAVRRTVEKLHSYQVPEVICLPIIDGAPNYLNWLSGAVTEEPEPVIVEPERAKPGKSRRR